MTIPPIDQLKQPTLEYVRAGVSNSDEMRRRLAHDFKLTDKDLSKKLANKVPKFTNNHAWALVRLGERQDGLIKKVAKKTYVPAG